MESSHLTERNESGTKQVLLRGSTNGLYLMDEADTGKDYSSVMFDNMCSSFLTSLHFLQSSINELLCLKDELLSQSLPPVVHSKIALCTTKVFRSMSDCWVPANELTRLVKLYSMPWEEKNNAFKKLYENFDSKKSQLDIAIRRLKLLEDQCNWLERENRMKTLENMFVKTLSAKGCRRRWRFLTAWFKAKSKDGPRSLQRFVRQMTEVVDSDEEEEGEESSDDSEVEKDYKIATQMLPQERIRSTETELRRPEALTNDEPEPEDRGNEDLEKSRKVRRRERYSFSQLFEESRPRTKSPKSPKPPRPVTSDKQSWTHEPEFEFYLCVRIFRPEEFGEQDLVCCMQFGDQTISVEFPQIPGTPEFTPISALRMRSPIQRRNNTTADASHNAKKTHEDQQTRYIDCMFCITEEEMLHGPQSTQLQLNFDIFSGLSNDTLLAKAIVGMDDLNTMDLQTVTIPLPNVQTSTKEATQSLKQAPGRTIPDFQLEGYIKSLKPTVFPLYSIKDDICGYLPLVFTWAKQEKPRTVERATESENVEEIVYELTGLDPTSIHTDDLHRDTEDPGTSPRGPELEEFVDQLNTVPRAEYEKVLKGHVEEIEILRNEYEMRLQEMLHSLREMEEAYADMQRLVQTSTENAFDSEVLSRLRSGPSWTDSKSPSKADLQQPPRDGRSPRRTASKYDVRLTRSSSSLGAEFPNGLKHLEGRNQRYKQEPPEKTKQQTIEDVERKLGGIYKLSSDGPGVTSSDLNLPAVFMPTKNRDLSMYNPKAFRYFHATGAHGLKLDHSPSTPDLPPITSNSTIPVINLYEMRRDRHQPSSPALINHHASTWLPAPGLPRSTEPGFPKANEEVAVKTASQTELETGSQGDEAVIK